MPGCFGLCEDHGNPYRFPGERIIEHVPRIDIRMLARCGALVLGTTTEVEITPMGGPAGSRSVKIFREGSSLMIDGALVQLAYDDAFGRERPWFVCPICARRSRHLYLLATIGCRKCLRLDYACRHLRRSTPAVGRIERLRRRLGDCEIKPLRPAAGARQAWLWRP